jgi:hypothetical protein
MASLSPEKKAHEYKAKYNLNAKRDQGNAFSTKKQLNAIYSKTPEGKFLKYVQDIPYDYSGVTETRIGKTDNYHLPPVHPGNAVFN